MPGVPEDLDVFRLPHVHMKKLVEDIEKHVSCSCMNCVITPLVVGSLVYDI